MKEPAKVATIRQEGPSFFDHPCVQPQCASKCKSWFWWLWIAYFLFLFLWSYFSFFLFCFFSFSFCFLWSMRFYGLVLFPDVCTQCGPRPPKEHSSCEGRRLFVRSGTLSLFLFCNFYYMIYILFSLVYISL
jgi:hypothetical protein